MNLIRIIVIALIIYLLIQIFKRWQANKKPSIKATKETKMVKCKQCKLHIPENEAIKKGENFFCSQEHLDENKKD